MSKPISTELLESLEISLYPIFLARLQSEGHLSHISETKNTRKSSPLYPEGVYLPEVDYMIYTLLQNGLLREGRYKGNSMSVVNARSGDIAYGYDVHGGSEAFGYEHTLKRHVLLPSANLKIDLQVYEIEYKNDYRTVAVGGSSAYYMRGVMDLKSGEVIKNSAAAYKFDLLAPLTPAILHNTRDQWKRMGDREKAMRIVSEDTMMRLLNAFESGTAKPGEIPWQIDTLSSGESMKDFLKRSKEAPSSSAISPHSPFYKNNFFNPLKINANAVVGTPYDAEQWAEEDEE